MGLKLWLKELASMIWPNICEVCSTTLVHGEAVMCLACRSALPRTGLHADPFNEIHKRLASHVPIDKAASYFYYVRGNHYTRLIHAAKYQGRPYIVERLAADYATELSATGFFAGIDAIVPVPMHRSKVLSRGYNQTVNLARGLSSVTSLPVIENALGCRPHSTQTRFSAHERLQNARDTFFAVDTAPISGRHILLVDDVLTTGATMIACCEALYAADPSITISVLTLAITRLQ